MYFEGFQLGFSNRKINPCILGNLQSLNQSFVSWKSSLKIKKQRFLNFSNFEKWWFYIHNGHLCKSKNFNRSNHLKNLYINLLACIFKVSNICLIQYIGSQYSCVQKNWYHVQKSDTMQKNDPCPSNSLSQKLNYTKNILI